MTHENLTPYEAMPYSVKRNMEGNGEQQSGGSRPQAPQGSEVKVNQHPKNPVERHKSPPTSEQIEAAKELWKPIIAKTKDPDEREMMRGLAEMGRPPIGGGAPDIDLGGITNPAVRILGSTANEFLSVAGESMDMLLEARRNIMEGVVPADAESQKRLLIQRVNERIRTTREAEVASEEAKKEARRIEYEKERKERFGMYLQADDIHQLDGDAMKWLNGQFDIIYKSAAEGQELQSRIVDNIQTVIGEATRWMQYNKTPEEIDEFQKISTIRFNLMTMRTTVGYRSIENIQRSANSLGVHGLIYGLHMEDGKVGSMFNRLNELAEDERLKSPAHHATPEAIGKLQDNLIDEQVKLAVRGVGPYAGLSETEARADITRAVRTAYDVFVSSQRQAVIVARGRHLTGADAYFSDPASGPLNVYNLEDLLIKKFDIYNAHEQEFVERIKLSMAEYYIREKRGKEGETVNLSKEEKVDLGTRLFRDLFAVPDFFSSGWRIKGVLDAIDERFVAQFGEAGRGRAQDFALFMRIKAGSRSTKEGVEEMRGVWGRISKIRPEDIVRLYRERAESDPRLTALFANDVFARNHVANYDQFKDQFGTVLRLLREDGYRDFRQLKIANEGFTAIEREKIRQYFGEDKANDMREMFRLMTAFSERSIDELVGNNKFEDIYTRTISTDDALLDRLEDTEGGRFIALSKRYAADQGGDAYVRAWNDTANAIKAGGSLIQFIKLEDGEKKIQAAEEFAEATSQYNGQAARAKCIRFTIGTFFELSKADFMWDAIGVGKLPFRKAMSNIERIYGPQVQAMSRDQLRGQLDKVHNLLVGELKKNFESMTEEEQKKNLEETEAFYKDLEKVLEVDLTSAIKRRGVSLLLFLILGTITELYQVSKDSLVQK